MDAGGYGIPPAGHEAVSEGQKLKACPFCGGAAEVRESMLADGFWWGGCRDNYCDATGPSREDKAAAIAAWNRRAEHE